MNLWLTVFARSLVVLAILSLPIVGVSRQIAHHASVSPSASPSCVRVSGRSRESSSECSSALYMMGVPARCPQSSARILPPASLGEEPELEREVPLGWLSSDDAIHSPSRRALHAMGDHPITALERRVERCRLTL